ncbi:permease-like cell division protein FtsX [Salinisphaera orenii]|uniref:permease-like cell division protein FtsX n=1 Tax=Salinisphaera orenii TaxID=856731 RepID=UPI000DBE354A
MAGAERNRAQPTRPTRDHGAVGRWFEAHGRCLRSSLDHIARRRLASALTIVVIGITLALPTGLFIAAKNLAQITANWQQSVTVSLYLSPNADGPTLTQQLGDKPNIASAEFVSARQGLAELKKHSDLGPALDALGRNPLPAVIRIHPRPGIASEQVQSLAKQLGQRSDVARARLDAGWIRRLNAIVDLATRAAVVVAILLGCAVLFIVGNTIGLEIENRRDQIEVMKLLGATDAFIRRPFIYGGLCYGLFGGLVGLVILGAAALALHSPLNDLVAAYNGQLSIVALSATGALTMVAIGMALGWVGSVFASTRRLAAIEPR